MKILRITHGATNNFVDLEVVDGFNLVAFVAEFRAAGGIFAMLNGLPLWINAQCVQNIVMMTPEQQAALAVQGLTKN